MCFFGVVNPQTPAEAHALLKKTRWIRLHSGHWPLMMTVRNFYMLCAIECREKRLGLGELRKAVGREFFNNHSYYQILEDYPLSLSLWEDFQGMNLSSEAPRVLNPPVFNYHLKENRQYWGSDAHYLAQPSLISFVINKPPITGRALDQYINSYRGRRDVSDGGIIAPRMSSAHSSASLAPLQDLSGTYIDGCFIKIVPNPVWCWSTVPEDPDPKTTVLTINEVYALIERYIRNIVNWARLEHNIQNPVFRGASALLGSVAVEETGTARFLGSNSLSAAPFRAGPVDPRSSFGLQRARGMHIMGHPAEAKHSELGMTSAFSSSGVASSGAAAEDSALGLDLLPPPAPENEDDLAEESGVASSDVVPTMGGAQPWSAPVEHSPSLTPQSDAALLSTHASPFVTPHPSPARPVASVSQAYPGQSSDPARAGLLSGDDSGSEDNDIGWGLLGSGPVSGQLTAGGTWRPNPMAHAQPPGAGTGMLWE